MIADLQRQLGIDLTFFHELGLFLFIYLWLKYFYFSPYLTLLLSRNNKTTGLKEESARVEIESQKKVAQYESKLQEARRLAALERESILQAARLKAAAVVYAAKKSAKEKLDSARINAEQQAQAEFARLEENADDVSLLFIEKLTRQKVGL